MLLHDQLGRSGGGDCPQCPEHDQPAVRQRQSLRWKPQHDGFESRHQRHRDAEADQRAPNQQADEMLSQSEHERSRTRQQQQQALDGLRPVTIEQAAQRQLHDCKHQEIDRREEPEIRWR